MARRLTWSPTALRDLEEIFAYVARDSERYAKIVTRKIIGAAERAAMFPQMGRVVPEFDMDGVREVLAYHYRIIYRIGDGDLQVAAVIHGARDLRSALTDRGGDRGPRND